MFLMLSVKKYLVPNKQSMVSTGENTLPTVSACLAQMAHFPPCSILQKNVSVTGLFHKFTNFLDYEKPTFFLLKAKLMPKIFFILIERTAVNV